jgi:hypothetical protein
LKDLNIPQRLDLTDTHFVLEANPILLPLSLSLLFFLREF